MMRFLFLPLLLAACAAQTRAPNPPAPTMAPSAVNPPPAAIAPAAATAISVPAAITLSPDGREVGTYISSWNGFRTSSYWIEGPTGLILIDTQFLLSAGDEFVDWAEKVTGKKAVLAVVLHPNPDKFNGTAHLQARGVKVITSQEVLDLIPAVHKLRLGWFYDRFKPDYPLEQPKPESFGAATTEIEAAGLRIKLHVLGQGCSGAHVVAQYGDHVFVGDLVTIGFHSWLELGLLDEWLERLDDIRGMNPKFVHTGRGGTGDLSAVDREQEYLEEVIAVLQKHHPHGKLGDGTRMKIVGELQAKYPAYDFPLFLKVDALWKRMSEQPENFE